jgi:ornithine cyclodeaminase/alanine dehydrogenase
MRRRYDFEVIPVSEPRLAVIESDLVVTSGPILKDPQPVIAPDWLPVGGFASAVDYASYWTPAAIAQMDRFCTDDLAQFYDHRQHGYFAGAPDPALELGELLSGAAQGRTDDRQRTLVMNLGLAMDDMAVAPEVYRRAKALGLGTWLEG